jgi:integrase
MWIAMRVCLRIGEVCGLNWEAVDLQTGIVKIECTIVWDQYSWAPRVKNKPKNGKIRYLVMPEVLVQELKRLIKSRDLNVPFLFHKNGTPYNRQSVAKAYRRALERMGLSHIKGTHWIRKTSATLANQITGDFYAVSRLMDHSSPNVTLRYVSPTNAEKQKVANALNSVVNQSTDKAPKAPEPQGADPAVPLCPLQENRPRLSLVKSAI